MKQISKTLKPATLLFLVTSSLYLSGCEDAEASSASKDKEQAKKEEVVKVPVETKAIKTGDIAHYYAANAVLESIDDADIITNVHGLIKDVLVEEGDYVEQGELLAQVDATRYKLTLEQKNAQLAKIKTELDRLSNEATKSYISDDQLSKLQWQYKALKAEQKLAALDVHETNIVAPISGFIAKRYVKPGNLIQRHQAKGLFHIVSLEKLRGVIHLPESQLSNLNVGQPVNLTLPALNNKQVVASVERISPIVNDKTGTVKVVFIIDNEKRQLKAGMFAEVNIEFGRHSNTLLAPANAIINEDSQQIAYLVIEGKAVKTPVTTGYQHEGVVEITSGVSATDFIITAGHNNLKDNTAVNVVNQ